MLIPLFVGAISWDCQAGVQRGRSGQKNNNQGRIFMVVGGLAVMVKVRVESVPKG